MNLETKSNEAERTEQSRTRRRITLGIGGGLGLVILGIAVGTFFRADTPEQSDEPTELATTNLPKVTERSVVRTPEQANLHILERDFRGALKVYETLPLEEMTDELRYKQALCLEMLEQWEASRAIYQRLADSVESHDRRLAALTGAVRTRIGQKEFREAKIGAFTTLLESDNKIHGDLRHLLSYSACNSAYERNENLLTGGIRVPFQPAQPELAIDLWRAEDEITTESEDAPATTGKTSELKLELLDRLSSDPQDIHVNLQATDETLMTLVRAVAKAAQISVNWTPSAMSALDSHKVSVSIEDIDVATLLDALLEPSRMCWEPIPRGVGVRLQREMPRQKLAALHRAQAKRIASTTVTLHPDHTLQEQTYMCLGNMAFWDESLDEATAYFEEITDTFRRPSVVKTAWFNLARVHWIAEDYQACRDAMLHVVDQADGATIESIAYYFLGLLELGNHQPQEAAKFLGRAKSLSKDLTLQTQSTIYMCVAQLMANNPQAANRVLTDNRTLIRTDAWKNEAAFLNSLSRFSAAASTEEQVDEGRDLVATLAYVDTGKFAENIGYYLVGQAFDQLGYTTRVEQVFAVGAAVRKNELSHRMTMRMANIARDDRRLGDARRHLDGLAEVEASEWSLQAKIEFARLDFEAKKYSSCISRGVQLLPECSPTERAQVLNLLGRAFERQDNHYQAALCFAGMIPTQGVSLQPGDTPAIADRLRR